jgi:hypothetical protein
MISGTQKTDRNVRPMFGASLYARRSAVRSRIICYQYQLSIIGEKLKRQDFDIGLTPGQVCNSAEHGGNH